MPKRSGIKPNTSIRIDPEAMHAARVAAVTARKKLGEWLEEAISEKVERERQAIEESQAKGADRAVGSSVE